METQKFSITIEVIDGNIQSKVEAQGFNGLELLGLKKVIKEAYDNLIEEEVEETEDK